ncbi:Ig-like domain-containing protein [Scopulibacillus cellulosilyticus]|uniref:Ig-like domain-containing protein n=1 Tax=Scopulibacillus cellulosilyticus TaxID=2665665 RepID=A0ABW2Q5W5_9BACL
MRVKKKGIYLFLTLLLLLSTLPTGAFANDKGKTESSKKPRIKVHLNQKTSPLKDKNKNHDYHNPNDYPLVNPGQSIRTLTDKKGGHHYLTYNSITAYSASLMEVEIGYRSYDYNKDPYLNIEFFTNNNGEMVYLGSSDFYVGDINGGIASLSTGFSKSLYSNDPFIYMRIGTLANLTDKYYSDVTYFKVANPFYKGSQGPSDSNNYALVSNESTDGYQSENLGSFKINNDKYTFNKKIDKDAYRMDTVIPFDVKKYKDKLIKKNSKSIKSKDEIGDSKSFWVDNLETDDYYPLSATLLYSGAHSNVWVNDNQITSEQAAQLGKEFEDRIYNSDVDNFGNESDVDGNGKVNILCYDIQDGFSGSGGYIAGYFDPRDLFNMEHSNESEIFYIDTYPLMGMGDSKDVSEAYSTLAHEFQHMINFNQKVFVQGNFNDMDTWMNEGLSMAAEQIYLGKALQDRIDYYNYDTDIANGHSLLYWDNYGDTLANYSLSYLFMQYLKVQSGQGNHIFKELIDDPHTDYEAVEDMVKKYIDPNLTFGKFMTDYRAALLLKENSGLYGFQGESGFDSIKERIYNGSSLSLRGGGAIVKRISSPDDFSIPADKGEDVTYTFLKKGGDQKKLTKPSVNPVGDNDTSVTGKADSKVKVTVTSKSNELGHVNADDQGDFRVTIPKQKAGSELHVYAEDAYGNKSEETIVTVSDKTPPEKPKVNEISDASTKVSGTTESGAKVTVKNGSTVLGSGKATEGGAFSIPIAKQKAGTKLTVYAEDDSGNKSEETIVTLSDKTPPEKPKVNEVSDASTSVTGTTEAEAKVTVKRSTTVLGSAKAEANGKFNITINKQKAGTKLTIYSEDDSGNKSEEATVTVSDKTPPAKPKVDEVSDASTYVTGSAETGSKVTVKNGSMTIGSGNTDSKGAFKIKITKQKAGTTLSIYAEDAAHNKSATVTIKVMDKTPPAKPTVSTFGDNQTTISGKAEPESKVTIKYGKTVLGYATANSKGNFQVKIKHNQKAGTTLTAYATDKGGNQSQGATFKVIDKTPPTQPTVNKVTSKSTVVTGKAEKGSTVYLYNGSKYLGKATANSKGNYSIKIQKQKKGTTLKLYAKDKAGNKGKYKYIKVQ